MRTDTASLSPLSSPAKVEKTTQYHHGSSITWSKNLIVRWFLNSNIIWRLVSLDVDRRLFFYLKIKPFFAERFGDFGHVTYYYILLLFCCCRCLPYVLFADKRKTYSLPRAVHTFFMLQGWWYCKYISTSCWYIKSWYEWI